MLHGEGEGKQGKQGSEERLVGKAGIKADEVVDSKQGEDEEDQFGQLVGAHWR